MPTMNRFGFLVVALSLAGCGTVWVDGSYLQRPPFVKGTVEVEARAEASRAEGIQIVEQPSGQGFIVDPEGDRLRRSALSAHVAVDVEVRSAARCAGCSDGADGELGAWGDSIVMEEASESSRSIGESSGLPESAMASAAIAVGPLADEGVAGVGVVSSDVHVGGLEVWGAQVGERGTGSSAINRESLGAVGLALEALEIEARASVARQGVWGLDGRSTAITAITGPGVQVDGVRVALDELEALATLPMPGPASARLVTDGAIEAWAELEHESLPRSGGETHVVVRVRAASSVSTTPRPSVRVHLVIDASSSMQRSWTRMLDAARELIARLAADDELQIVAYGTDAVEVFPVGRVADGRAALAALERVAVGGGTNIQAGLERAYAAASGSARSLVILLSDGVPTRGAFEPAEFGGLASAGRARGAITSVVGLGTEFDDRLLRAVAKSGHGGYHVSASPDELATGLLEELEAHARFTAQNLRVRVSLGEGVELVGAPEGGAKLVEGGVLLESPRLSAGTEHRIFLRVRVPGGATAKQVASVSLEYRSMSSGRTTAARRTLEVSFGARAVPASDGLVGTAMLDALLAAALESAGDAIARGDAADAKRALDEHARLAEGRVELHRSPVLQARVRVIRRLGEAVHVLLPSATHAQRRQVAHAFGELAMRFAR